MTRDLPALAAALGGDVRSALNAARASLLATVPAHPS